MICKVHIKAGWPAEEQPEEEEDEEEGEEQQEEVLWSHWQLVSQSVASFVLLTPATCPRCVSVAHTRPVF